jgi:hypothetical protein
VTGPDHPESGTGRILAAVFTASLFLLAACGSPITSGTVTAKQDTPGYVSTIQVPQYRTQCTTEEEDIGSPPEEEPEEECTQVIAYYLPYTSWVPETWQLQIKDGTRSGWVGVSESAYDSARIGSRWKAAQ